MEKSDLMVGCCDMLTPVWVQVSGVPIWARQRVVEEVAYLVGDFVEMGKKLYLG